MKFLLTKLFQKMLQHLILLKQKSIRGIIIIMLIHNLKFQLHFTFYDVAVEIIEECDRSV